MAGTGEMTAPLVSLRNLEKSYPQGVGRSYVLRRIVRLAEGRIVSDEATSLRTTLREAAQ